MASYPTLTQNDRAYRREKIVRVRRDENLGSRPIAARFGLSDGYVRSVLREADAQWPTGRPAHG